MGKTVSTTNRIKKVAIIGPECAGKTTLAEQLAKHYNTIWVPEYARNYIESLNRNYNFHDVDIIAQKQWEQINAFYPDAKNFIFFDTDLIITKVWFKIVFKKIPDWIENAIKKSKFDIYLLCNTEIPWVADNVRENGGVVREKLFDIYENELHHLKFSYQVITGKEEQRINNAISALKSFL